jgi:hypothetical protein
MSCVPRKAEKSRETISCPGACQVFRYFVYRLSRDRAVDTCEQACIRDFENQLVRLTLGKPPRKVFEPKVVTGRMTKEKIITCRDSWVKYVSKQLELNTLAADVSYTFAVGDADEPEADEVAE